MTHYRVPFFLSLRETLKCRGVELILAHGNGSHRELAKDDSGSVDWSVLLKTKYFLGGRVCFQNFIPLAQTCDLSVVTLENKLIWNLFEQYFGRGRKLALWGHGANLQGADSSFRETAKRRFARQADWWFGYTEMSLPLITRSGFPRDRITVLNNSVDTRDFRDQYLSVTEKDRAFFLDSLGLKGRSVGVFVGSLYDEKRIPFLLEASDKIHGLCPEFELLILGAGDHADLVDSYCRSRPWARYLGARKGKDKAIALSVSRVFLNPGLVGLGILDSFVSHVPLVTTDCGLHSPEISYLLSGFNGVMTEDSLPSFVDAVTTVLSDPDFHARLQAGCAESASRYTVENMANNFADGVEACLRSPSYRWKD